MLIIRVDNSSLLISNSYSSNSKCVAKLCLWILEARPLCPLRERVLAVFILKHKYSKDNHLLCLELAWMLMKSSNSKIQFKRNHQNSEFKVVSSSLVKVNLMVSWSQILTIQICSSILMTWRKLISLSNSWKMPRISTSLEWPSRLWPTMASITWARKQWILNLWISNPSPINPVLPRQLLIIWLEDSLEELRNLKVLQDLNTLSILSSTLMRLQVVTTLTIAHSLAMAAQLNLTLHLLAMEVTEISMQLDSVN